MEDGRDEQLVVDGHSHVPRLVERRRHGADGVAQVHPPEQEEELRWGAQELTQVNGCSLRVILGCCSKGGHANSTQLEMSVR